MPAGAYDLEWLLDPIKPADFYERHYEKEPLFVSRREHARFANVFSLESVDELLAATVSTRARPATGERLIRSEPDGTLSERTVRLTGNAAVDVQAVYRLYHDGFTVVLNQVHRRSATVGRLCRALQTALHHLVGANLYLTPAGAQGFLPHVDTHDVFILQLHGAKEWHVSDPRLELPLARGHHGKQDLHSARTYALTPGDVLYLPRGFRHAAVTGDSSSLHLTVGIYAFRWHDLLREALDVLAEEDVAFRRALPPHHIDQPLDMALVTDLARRLSVALSDGEVLANARARIASRLVAADAAVGRGRFRSLDALAGLTDESAVMRPSDVLCLVRLAQNEATIEFAGNFVTGPGHIGPALQYVAQNERFRVRELPGDLSAGDRVDLVKRLVSEGLLEVV